MIKRAFDIMQKNLMKVDVLNATRKVQDIFHEKGIECFIVYEGDKLTGVVTKNELIAAHPNRIVADVMSHKYTCVDCKTWMWEIKEKFDSNEDISVILVEKEHEVIGYITRTTMNVELGKHIDLLTDLYKSDYMFYSAYKLIKCGKYATIIFIDLNNFGYINKKYGHIVGDEILRSMAYILKSNLEPKFYLCRYAGDEFTIVTENSIDYSKLFAEKIIKSINSYTFLNNIQVSASIGITRCIMRNNKLKSIIAYINKIVNAASLASTKAKKAVNNLIVVGDVKMNEGE